jgi:hypothetical protein
MRTAASMSVDRLNIIVSVPRIDRRSFHMLMVLHQLVFTEWGRTYIFCCRTRQIRIFCGLC